MRCPRATALVVAGTIAMDCRLFGTIEIDARMRGNDLWATLRGLSATHITTSTGALAGTEGHLQLRPRPCRAAGGCASYVSSSLREYNSGNVSTNASRVGWVCFDGRWAA